MKAYILGSIFLLAACDNGLLSSGAGRGPETVVVVITDPEDKVIAPTGNIEPVGIQDNTGESNDGNVQSGNDTASNTPE